MRHEVGVGFERIENERARTAFAAGPFVRMWLPGLAGGIHGVLVSI
jgi:hypothetical protein